MLKKSPAAAAARAITTNPVNAHVTEPGIPRKNTPNNSGPGRQIRVLVADDHPVVRKGLSLCLAQAGPFVIVGEAYD